MHVWVCVSVYLCQCVTRARMYFCVHVDVSECLCVYLCVHVDVGVCVYICVCMAMCARVCA